MTTKVEPTVDKWEIEKKFYEDLANNEWILDDPYSPDMVQMPFHELEKRVHTLLSHSVQEAKAERDGEWIKELKPTGIGNSLYIMPSNHLFDSIKQEEEQ